MKTIIVSFILVLLCGVSHASLIRQVDKGLFSRTDILAIYKNGELVYEEYRNGYTANQKHRLWSMSKSVTSLLVGKAIKEGRMQLTDSVCQYVPVNMLHSASQCEITIEKLLFWQSGVKWSEVYLGLDASQVLEGLYGRGINDFASYFFSIDHDMSIENNWNYSTGDTHILGYLLKQVYGPIEYEALPWANLFDPLGIKQATFERDHQGTYLGGSYIYLTHGGLNKIAQYVLKEMKGEQELPLGWFDNMLVPRPENTFTLEMSKKGIAPAIPAGHWWVNRPSNPEIQEVPWLGAPEDTFGAFGVFGQMMYLVPSQDLVIIRFAQDIKGGFDRDRFLDVTLKFAEGV